MKYSLHSKKLIKKSSEKQQITYEENIILLYEINTSNHKLRIK
jgi:hypothetical protein